MSAPPESDEARHGSLSARERQIMALAIEGMTDAQIAHRMGISVSTVTSYWVRIRGKLGHVGRTQLAVEYLRAKLREREAALAAEVERLTEAEARARNDLARARTDVLARGEDGWAAIAIDLAPCALLVVRAPGIVVYANREADRLLARAPGSLAGTAIWDAAVPERRARGEWAFRTFFEAPAPERTVVGLDGPHYAHRGDGTSFRAVLTAEPFEGPEGRMACVALREFLGDLETLLAEIRVGPSLV